MTQSATHVTSPPFRRVAAFAADYMVIAVYAALLTFVSFQITGGDFQAPASAADKLSGHIIGFATMTLPVVLYFTFLEAGRGGASFGKRLLGVRVVDASGEPVGIPRSLVRNALKFLPWEVAHAAIWHVPDRPFLDPMPPINLSISIGALALALIYIASMFFGGRTIYDRIAGTGVIKK